MKQDMQYIAVKKSDIHSKGVFAKKDIPEGTRMIQYVGEKITKLESDRRAETVLEQSKKNVTKGAVYIFTLNQRYDIDGNVSWNPARFINHSCEPNAESDIIQGKIWIIATRDIKKGEEISYDYGYDLEDFEEHPCYCSSKSCVGYIVDSNLREKLKRKLSAKKAAKKKKAVAIA